MFSFYVAEGTPAPKFGANSQEPLEPADQRIENADWRLSQKFLIQLFVIARQALCRVPFRGQLPCAFCLLPAFRTCYRRLHGRQKSIRIVRGAEPATPCVLDDVARPRRWRLPEVRTQWPR